MTPATDARARCKVKTILDRLEDDDRKLLEGFMEDHELWSSHALSNALKQRDVNVSTNVLIRHRKGNCSC
jgi:hypothetical protein